MKNLIIFTAFNQAPDNIEYAKWCYESWKVWAEKYEVHILSFNDPLRNVAEMKPTWQRWHIFDILDSNNITDFSQVALIDVDTLIHPDAPNFFDITADRPGIGVVQDDLMVEWVLNSLKGYKKFFPETVLDWTEYFNCGFIVLKNDEQCRSLCSSITGFYYVNEKELRELQHTTLRKGSDQTPVNYIAEAKGVSKIFLNKRWNFTHTHIRGILTPYNNILQDAAYVYHFNGFEKSAREKIMSGCWNDYLKPLIK